jgi:hypothetical protein
MDKRIRLTQELSPAKLMRRNSISTKLHSEIAKRYYIDINLGETDR